MSGTLSCLRGECRRLFTACLIRRRALNLTLTSSGSLPVEHGHESKNTQNSDFVHFTYACALLTRLLTCDSHLNSEFALSHTLASNLGTSAAVMGVSFPEARQEEYTEDFTGEYGLEYWNRRRTAWLTGRPIQSTSDAQSPQGPRMAFLSPGIADPPRNGTPRKPSKTVTKLCEVMAPPFAEEDDAIWNHGVRSVWKSLSHGDKLKYPLPLPIVVRHSFFRLKSGPSDSASCVLCVRVGQDTTRRLAARWNLANRITDSRRRHRNT